MTESICLIIHLDIFFWNLVQKNIDCSLCIPLAAQRITLQHITNLLAELKSAKAISWQISLFSHEQVKHQIDKTRNKTENHFLIFFSFNSLNSVQKKRVQCENSKVHFEKKIFCCVHVLYEYSLNDFWNEKWVGKWILYVVIHLYIEVLSMKLLHIAQWTSQMRLAHST